MNNEEYTDDDFLEWINDKKNYNEVLNVCDEILAKVEPLAQKIRDTEIEGIKDPRLQYFVESRTHSMVNDMLYADDGLDYISCTIHGLKDNIEHYEKTQAALWAESAKKLVT